jgi:hypothetical protein
MNDERHAWRRIIRGWSAEEREAFLREAALADEREWTGFVQRDLEDLARALFTYLMLVKREGAQRAATDCAALRIVPPGCWGDCGSMLSRLGRSLARLRTDRGWLATQSECERLFTAEWVRRMSRVSRRASALRKSLEVEVVRHLAGGGLSPGEIRRRTEAAERLWRAA